MPTLGDFVRDPAMARALGKALFWDMQVGSDGVQACASCHFRAGADPRSKNQLSPGLKRARRGPHVLDRLRSEPPTRASDFPLTRLAIPGVRGALNPSTTATMMSSLLRAFIIQVMRRPPGFPGRWREHPRVEPRNTPSVINAVFNHRQFWDGRAENVFNGVNHLGQRDPDAKLFRADDPRSLIEVRIELLTPVSPPRLWRRS